MCAKGRIVLVCICLLLIPVTIGAADYKNWLGLIPETLGGLSRAGDPDGINMEMGGQSWSSLHQEYSNNGKGSISLTIVSGIVAPQAQAFQMMSHMKMETPEEIVNTLDVSGYKAVCQLEKKKKRANLMISVNQQTIVTIEAEQIANEKAVVALAKELPLAKMAAQVK